ncbi:hypothetical protein quinque_002875 [Culex quinquefasciatus]
MVKRGFLAGKSTGMILLDVEKAYDSVWQDAVVYKLFRSNLQLFLVKIVESFLTNRSFTVTLITDPKNLSDIKLIAYRSAIVICHGHGNGPGSRAGVVLHVRLNLAAPTTTVYSCFELVDPSQYCIHLLLSDSSQLAFIETLDSALQLLSGHLAFGSIYVYGTNDPADNKHPPKELIRNLNVHIKYLNNGTVKNFIGTDNLPIRCCGFYVHDQREWIDFFRTLEPLQGQCIETGRRLVTVLNDIRNLEVQGTPPTRRQLHSQHRALSRALMDSELQNLRRKGPNTIQRLQDKLTVINNKQTLKQTKNLVRNSSSSLVDSSSSGKLATATGNGRYQADLINALSVPPNHSGHSLAPAHREQG